MKNKKVGTITLALGLIILGAILFINNFTEINIADLYKYWPVLIISVGIEMFIYVIIYRHDEKVRLRIDALCIIFIIIAGVTAGNPSFKFDSKLPFNIFNISSIFNGGNYKSELRETIIRDSISKDFNISKIEVKNNFGDIKLMPHNQNYIKVEAIVKVKYNDEQKAREYLKRAVKITEGEQTQISVLDSTQIDKNSYAAARIDFVIYIPQDIEADLDCSFGNIQVQGVTKDLTVNNQHGNIIVNDIRGNTDIENSFGKIKLKNISGKVEADNQHGNIEADFINGDIRLETSFGEIIVSDIEGNAEIKNSFGKIQYSSSNEINAEIYAKTSFGSIETKLPLNVTKSVNEYTVQGKIGEGKYRIELITNNGEIEIQ